MKCCRSLRLRALLFLSVACVLEPTHALTLEEARKIGGEREKKIFQSMPFYDPLGRQWTLQKWAHLRKRPIMVVAWATYCGPCMGEMPSIQEMKKIMGKSLDVLPICVEKLKPGYSLPNIKMPLFYSRSLAGMMSLFDMNGIPAVLIFSPDGQLLHREVGAKDWSSPENIKFLKNRIQSRLIRNNH